MPPFHYFRPLADEDHRKRDDDDAAVLLIHDAHAAMVGIVAGTV